MLKRTTLGLLLSSACFFAAAQNFELDMAKIGEAYKNAEACHLELEYRLYKSHTSMAVFERGNAKLIRKGSQFFYRFFDLEAVVNDKYVVVLDHESQTFMIDRFDAAAVQLETWVLPDSLATLFETAKPLVDRIEYTVQNNRTAYYTTYYNYGELEKQVIYFDRNKYQLEKVVQYFRDPQPIDEQHPDKPRLEMVYTRFDLNPTVDAQLFSEKNYATVIPDKKIELKPAYKGYTIINHLWRVH